VILSRRTPSAPHDVAAPEQREPVPA
jgi:hypothetical protein